MICNKINMVNVHFPDLLHLRKMAVQLQQSQATAGVHEVEAEDTFQVFWKFALTEYLC